MKKITLFFLLFITSWVCAETPVDSVVMTVAGKDVTLDEFLFMARKNKEVDLSDRKSVKNYVNLYKNFRLKVAEAESLGMDTLPSFKKELKGYGAQLLTNLMFEADEQENVVRAEYDRSAQALDFEHIVFRLPSKSLTKDTLATYQNAISAYQRLVSNPENFERLGRELMKESKGRIIYEKVNSLVPLRAAKRLENAVYGLPLNVISEPIRTSMGFHIIRVLKKKQNNIIVKAAHILLPDTVSESFMSEILKKARSGEDFGDLAKRYSIDRVSAGKKGVLDPFGLGSMIPEFENVVFAMQNTGDISEPVKSRYGYHIIKLIEKSSKPTFEQVKRGWGQKMSQNEWNFELNHFLDQRLKKEYGYVLYAEAYEELEKLSDIYFPSDQEFYDKAKDMNKILFHVADFDIPQKDFVEYIKSRPFSTKSYAGDFMHEIFDLFVRDILTNLEKDNFTTKHPEFNLLMQEYRDGILLFNICSKKIWNHPKEKQEQLEKDWLKELNKKYPVKINWKLIKSIK